MAKKYKVIELSLAIALGLVSTTVSILVILVAIETGMNIIGGICG